MSVKSTDPMAGRLMDVGQAAAYVGLAKATVYTMVSQRRIPYVKVGRLTKFDKGMLDKWIDKNTVMPMRQLT